MHTIVKELLSSDGRRKVQIFCRENGTFGFQQFRFSDDIWEMCWVQFGRDSECIVSDVQTAEHEARGRVEWLGNQKDEIV